MTPHRINIAKRKTSTLARRLRELSKALTYLRREVSVLRAFKGRSTRRTRIDFKASSASDSISASVVMKSKMAAMTIKKSMTFHGSRK